YQPKFCSEPQLPQLAPLPPEAATLQDLPWFESPSQSTGLGINARHVRYHHGLWQELKPKVLQGVHTTLVLALPQIGFALAPHIQLEKVFLFLGSLARGLGPVQLFPARYLYPDAHLGGLANMPAPIFADSSQSGMALPDWPHIHQELARKSVTLQLLWQEYRQTQPEGYGYSRFCELYRAWAGTLDPVLRQIHLPGEKMFVDWAGQKVEIHNAQDGSVSAAHLFV